MGFFHQLIFDRELGIVLHALRGPLPSKISTSLQENEMLCCQGDWDCEW